MNFVDFRFRVFSCYESNCPQYLTTLFAVQSLARCYPAEWFHPILRHFPAPHPHPSPTPTPGLAPWFGLNRVQGLTRFGCPGRTPGTFRRLVPPPLPGWCRGTGSWVVANVRIFGFLLFYAPSAACLSVQMARWATRYSMGKFFTSSSGLFSKPTPTCWFGALKSTLSRLPVSLVTPKATTPPAPSVGESPVLPVELEATIEFLGCYLFNSWLLYWQSQIIYF